PTTSLVLRRIFADESRFAHYAPLPSVSRFADEGAANHTRLFSRPEEAGYQIFTFGRTESAPSDLRFPARQSRDASAAIHRLHAIPPNLGTSFARQSARAIEAGAFHHDVVCVGHRDVLLVHEYAWHEQERLIPGIEAMFEKVCGSELFVIQV